MNRRTFLRYLKLSGLAGAGLAALPALRLLSASGTKQDLHASGGDKMAQAQELAASPRPIPPIDAYAPARTRTATFAMG